MQGFASGINAPQKGINTIVVGKFNNLKNINIETSSDKTRVVNINDASPVDPVVFVNNLKQMVNGVLTPVKQFDIYMNANFQPLFNDLTKLFNPDVVQIGLVSHNGQQVYFYEQAAGFTPFPSTAQPNKSLFGPKAAAYVPAELLNKTNAELFQQYGLAIGGVVAPANSVPDPLINGIVGAKAEYQTEVFLFSPRYYNFVTNGPYKLTYGYAALYRRVLADSADERLELADPHGARPAAHSPGFRRQHAAEPATRRQNADDHQQGRSR